MNIHKQYDFVSLEADEIQEALVEYAVRKCKDKLNLNIVPRRTCGANDASAFVDVYPYGATSSAVKLQSAHIQIVSSTKISD